MIDFWLTIQNLNNFFIFLHYYATFLYICLQDDITYNPSKIII